MMILTEGMNLEDVPAVVDRMGAEAETVDRAAEAPEMAVRMVVHLLKAAWQADAFHHLASDTVGRGFQKDDCL